MQQYIFASFLAGAAAVPGMHRRKGAAFLVDTREGDCL